MNYNNLPKDKQPRNETITSDFKSLESWYLNFGDCYPWRKYREPYKLLLTEVLLQRTRSDIVSNLVGRFFERYPDAYKLAEEDQNDLADFLKPLGLAHRVPRIKKLAKELVEKKKVPETYKELKDLPNVGPYVAEAVMCYAYGISKIPVDTNITRVMGRYLGEGWYLYKKKLEDHLGMMDNLDIRNVNWGLLDLSKKICTAKKPECQNCPLKSGCSHFNRP